MNEGATDQGGGDVAARTDDSSPKLTACKAWTARCRIVHSGTHAAIVGQYLADSDEKRKGDRESKAQGPIQSSAESQPADGGK